LCNPRSTPFPYTTPFRSADLAEGRAEVARAARQRRGERLAQDHVDAHGLHARFEAGGAGRAEGAVLVQHRHALDAEVADEVEGRDRKSTRLNSSHVKISY